MGSMRAAGPVEVKVTYFRKGDRSHQASTGEPLGIPIEELREQFGGEVGEVEDPFGDRHRISLSPQMPNGKDVYVGIAFEFQMQEHGH